LCIIWKLYFIFYSSCYFKYNIFQYDFIGKPLRRRRIVWIDNCFFYQKEEDFLQSPLNSDFGFNLKYCYKKNCEQNFKDNFKVWDSNIVKLKWAAEHFAISIKWIQIIKFGRFYRTGSLFPYSVFFRTKRQHRRCHNRISYDVCPDYRRQYVHNYLTSRL